MFIIIVTINTFSCNPKRTNGQKINNVNKTLHRKLKIEQHKPL